MSIPDTEQGKIDLLREVVAGTTSVSPEDLDQIQKKLLQGVEGVSLAVLPSRSTAAGVLAVLSAEKSTVSANLSLHGPHYED